jgi:hypothetical protein
VHSNTEFLVETAIWVEDFDTPYKVSHDCRLYPLRATKETSLFILSDHRVVPLPVANVSNSIQFTISRSMYQSFFTVLRLEPARNLQYIERGWELSAAIRKFTVLADALGLCYKSINQPQCLGFAELHWLKLIS